MTRVVAIHQPNFFPWLGYFDKIIRSDIFVLFDDVQYPKTGGAWCNRVKMLVSGEPRWVTAAIDRNYHGTRTIREMTFLDKNPWREKILKTIETNYGRHPHYGECMTVVEPLLLNQDQNIAAYNIHAIAALCRALGIDTAKLQISSALPHTGNSNELLCSITHAVGGSLYMCGGGADGYQDASVFENAGIELRYQAFAHPVYPQHRLAEFVPGLSVIDAVMNLGWNATAKLLERQ
jgi:hypothetical protein